MCERVLFYQDLDEDVVITLTGKNPQANIGIIRFDYPSGEYVGVKFIESMIDHLEIESTSLHKDSQEAQDQLQIDGTIKEGMIKIKCFSNKNMGLCLHMLGRMYSSTTKVNGFSNIKKKLTY